MTEIIKAGIADAQTIRDLANKIWPVTYGEILSAEQLKYMLEWIYSIGSLTDQMQNKQHEFYLAVNNGEKLGFISLEKNKKKSVKLHSTQDIRPAGIAGKKYWEIIIEFRHRKSKT